MAENAGIDTAHKTNHSARKTTVTTLLHANIPPTDVMQLTGHKNVQSLNCYSHMSNDQQHCVSNILSSRTSFASRPLRNDLQLRTSPDEHDNISVPNQVMSQRSPTPSELSIDDSIIQQLLNDDFQIDDSSTTTVSVPAPESSTNALSLKIGNSINQMVPKPHPSSFVFNGSISGNVSINFYNSRKRRRLHNSDSDSDSEE